MAIDKARKHLKEYKLDDRIIEFDDSSATVKEAAERLKCEEKDIVKTLSFLVGEEPIVICVSGDSRIDNSKYKEEFHTKAKMIPFEDVEKLIGHAVGGVCPFGINDNVKVYLDESLKKLDTMYPAAGSSNSAVRLNLKELESTLKEYKWVNVCK